MPTIPQGRVSFPGIRQVVNFSFTLSHGITPSVATLEIAPQRDFDAIGGNLIITYADTRMVFPGCRVQRHSVRLNQSGHVVSLAILDRRWAWTYRKISGWYNHKTLLFTRDIEQINFDQQRVRSARDLAILCLEAMGERNYDVSPLPVDQYPQVDWGVENPAQVLDRLVNQYGCRVVLRINNTVQIAKIGLGVDLPITERMEDSLSVNPPQVPDAIRIVCGKTEYQADFKLLAVGLDVDGSIRELDRLSYRPADGWPNEDPYLFTGVQEERPDGIRPRDLAKKTVWRWYQIYRTLYLPGRFDANGNAFFVPGYGPVRWVEQLLPLNDYQTTVAPYQSVITPRPRLGGDPAQVLRIGPVDRPIRVDPAGNVYRYPAWVYGRFAKPDASFTNWDENKHIDDGWTLNREMGIVEFDRPYFFLVGTGTSLRYNEALLHLRTSFSVRDLPTWAWNRYEVEERLPGGIWGTGPEILPHDEITLSLDPRYTGNNNDRLEEIIDNRDRIHHVISYYLQAAKLKYQTTFPREVMYAGIKAVSPDGAIQQVSWSIGLSGCTTRVGRNTEFSMVVPSYEQRRQSEQVRGDRMQRIQDAIQEAARQRQAEE